MTRTSRNHPTHRRAASALLPLLLALLAGACTSNPGAGGLTDPQGRHAPSFASRHGSFAGESGKACAPCHGEDLRGGISLVSCYSLSFDNVSCHAEGPAFHPATWLDCVAAVASRAAYHGTAFRDNLAVQGRPCTACHADLAAKCLSCHFSYLDTAQLRNPPASPWRHDNAPFLSHAPFENAATVRPVCVACHETHNRFGRPPACHNCHDGVSFGSPHGSRWVDPRVRGGAQWHGYDILGRTIYGKTCSQCHAVATECTVCHFSTTGGRNPSGTSFLHPGLSIHDTYPFTAAQRAVCVKCHEVYDAAGLSPRIGPPPLCHNCHGNGGVGD